MWELLNKNNRDQYRKLITNFASLSAAFAQKNDDSDTIIAPIINSKFQEASFKRAFNAIIEDIGNSSYDASIHMNDGSKYIIGIKSFGVNSGFQKVAQFKKDSQHDNWNAIIDRIKQRDSKGQSKEDINDYLELASKIATLRNKRISSSKAQLQGFKFDDTVEAVYHVLMPSASTKITQQIDEPYVLVGETSYSSIDIDHIKISGPTKSNMLQNFKFSDGTHVYQYNSADSQLLMSFKGTDGSAKSNAAIAVEKWPITYIEDAFSFFSNLDSNAPQFKDDHIAQTFTFMIKPERRSGFNSWFGAPKEKLSKAKSKYTDVINLASKYPNLPNDWTQKFEEVALGNFQSEEDKLHRESLRQELIECIDNNSKLFHATTIALWRDYENPYEVYIPIPNSKKFNDQYPDFFAPQAGLLNGNVLVNKKEDRTFTLEFLPSKEEMTMFLNQANGKAIQSYSSQRPFGKWVLKNIFQLKDRELLTQDTLDSLGINAIKFVKYNDGRPVSMEFTLEDPEHPSEHLWI